MNRSLNSFRAFAFMAVFGFHTAVLGNGYLGVNAFFVLSGFLLIPILRQTKATTSSAREFCVNFYGRRALRIFPAYYLFLLLLPLFIAIIQLPLGELFMKQLPWALTYTYDFYHASSAFQRNGMLAHLWSLAVEEQFYIVFPFVVLFASDKLLKWGFVVLMALGPVIRGTIWVVADTHLLPFVFREPGVVVYLLPFSHVDAFVTGGFFAVYLRGFVPTTKLLLSSFAALIALGLVTAKLATDSWNFASLGYAMFMKDASKSVWAYSAFSILFGLILLRVRRRDLLRRVFENRVIDYLGKISYGLYLFHLPIIRYISGRMGIPLVVDTPMSANRVYSIVLSLVVTVAISIASFELFERHFLALKDVFFAKKAPGANVAAVSATV